MDPVQLGRMDHGDHETENCTDTGVHDPGQGIADIALHRLGEHHHKIHHCTRLNGIVGPEQEIHIDHAEQSRHQINTLGNVEGIVVVEPVKGNDQKPTEKCADKTVEAVFEALLKLIAHAVNRADTGEAGIAAAQQVLVNQRHSEAGNQRFHNTHTDPRQLLREQRLHGYPLS